jgi:hypothetical protein
MILVRTDHPCLRVGCHSHVGCVGQSSRLGRVGSVLVRGRAQPLTHVGLASELISLLEGTRFNRWLSRLV